jgi:hypothetical protein
MDTFDCKVMNGSSQSELSTSKIILKQTMEENLT